MKLNKIIFDSRESLTQLCHLGSKHNTDKSPICNYELKHSYTILYNLIFSNLKYKKIKLGEIGIWKNGSIKMFKDFFQDVEIHGFEKIPEILQSAKNENLSNTYYHYMDCENPETIINSLEQSGGEFDILIDDGSHLPDHQINLMINCVHFLKPGGVLIIEDIFKSVDEELFRVQIEKIDKYFDSITFIETNHNLQYTGNWDNDKLLVMFRNNNIL